jgi:SAM-dependent methyltransferase
MDSQEHERQRDAGAPGVEELLASQIDYYRAHAPRYDDWWLRTGRHDFGERYRLSWEAEIATVSDALCAFAPFGEVLEFAGGTGNWTATLLPHSDSITVVDASPEAVAIARSKLGSEKVAWKIDDIFRYKPDRHYDTVFFSFWLSHVPPERFEEFWELVADSLSPDGRVFFVDNAHPSLSSGIPELQEWRVESTGSSLAGIDSRTDLITGVSTRRAADGATYDLVKIWRGREELEPALAALGWLVEVVTTDWAFIFGHGQREPAGRLQR